MILNEKGSENTQKIIEFDHVCKSGKQNGK